MMPSTSASFAASVPSMAMDVAAVAAAAAAAVEEKKRKRAERPPLSRKQREIEAAAHGISLPARGTKGRQHARRDFYGRQRDRDFASRTAEQTRAWELADQKIKQWCPQACASM